MNRLTLILAVITVLTLSVSYAEEKNPGSVPSGTGIGQLPADKEITRMGNSAAVAEYIPLDKGNVWTYGMVDGGEEKEHTQKIVSESDGWSVYDNFFGVSEASFRIAPGGDLLVTNKGQTRSFYGDSALISYPESVETPSGKYENVMVVTVPENKGLWFRDVYVRGVGLVFHEHKSPKGHSLYTLKKANVKGKAYPDN